MSNSQIPFLSIFESEARAIAQEASKYPNLETGGDLYGLWTHGDRPVVFLATGPGLNFRATPTEFQQDHEYMMECEKKLYEDFGIQYLGDWHSHHNLNLSQPSTGDVSRIHRYAEKSGRERMAEIIVTHTQGQTQYNNTEKLEQINPYLYPNAQICQPMFAKLLYLKEAESPIRRLLTYQKAQILNLESNWRAFPTHCIVAPDTEQKAIKHLNTESQIPDGLEKKLSQKLGKIKNKLQQGYQLYQLEDGNILLSIPLPNYNQHISFVLETSSLHILNVLMLNQSSQVRQKTESLKAYLELDKINERHKSIEFAIEQLQSKNVILRF